jgi:hypothetical protein
MSNELNEAFIREQTLGRLTDAVRATGQALPGTEAQIAQLIKDEFVLGVGSDGLPALTTKNGAPVQEFIASKLADAAYEHFRPAGEPESLGQRMLDEAKARGGRLGALARWLPEPAGSARRGL